ncbi:hypothetical protein G5714_017521 [Onychostoma macrolepis]|uniref:Uncharacterized protein n=1 Tax=Onychostoma macrolepis TaxID=369639 RepID=A0A7J6C1F0_9TELE|nr:hypothetical protein G5714_017521 [Onychostoma macrolepis]
MTRKEERKDCERISDIEIIFHEGEAEMAAVRDMYEGLDVEDMTETEQKRHRETQLNEHPDVLFRIYRRDRLHVLLFRPSDDGWWIKKLRDGFNGIFSQWTFKHAVNQPIRHVMNLSGDRDELQRFCDEFPVNLEEFNAHVQETEDLTARIRNLREKIEDDSETIRDLEERIQDLEERIGDLELENRKQRQQ